MTDSTIRSDQFRHPHKIGRYTVEGIIGQGAMGIVYRASDPIINRTVAIKKIRNAAIEGSSGSTESHDRFFKEIQAVGQLSHPNIIEVYDTGEHDGEPYLVTRYIEGRPLRKELDALKVLDTDRALAICRQILAALEHAHKKGIIHRDIKPSNILIDSEGDAKVIDFGLVKTKGTSLTQSGVTMGTLWYMSPEQVLGHNSAITERTDVFSVGVVLYEMLSGERPFTGSDASVVQKILNLDPVYPSLLNAMVPKWLDGVIARAMAKSPTERFASAAEFAAALDNPALFADPVSGSGSRRSLPPGSGARPAETEQRRPVWQKLAAGLVGLAVVAGGAFFAGQAMMGEEAGPPVVAEADTPRDGGGSAADPAPPGDTPQPPAPSQGGAEPPAADPAGEAAAEQDAWEAAIADASIDGFRAFLDDHPDGLYAPEARRRLAVLERRAAEQEAWEAALEANSIAAFEAFIEDYPEGTNTTAAVRRLQALERVAADDAAWARAGQVGSLEALRTYLADFPDGLHAAEARRQLEALQRQAVERTAWDAAREADTIAALEAFIADFPDGLHAAEARRQLEALEQQAVERTAWDATREANTIAALEAFIADYPESVHAETARRQIQALRQAEADAEAWRRAVNDGSEDAIRDYLDAFPAGLHAREARIRLDTLSQAAAEDAAWEAARDAGDVGALESFLADYPDSIHAAAAHRRIETLERTSADETAWRAVLGNPSIAALEGYLAEFPDGVHATEARRRLAALPRDVPDTDDGGQAETPGVAGRGADGGDVSATRDDPPPDAGGAGDAGEDADAQDPDPQQIAAEAEAGLGLSRFQRVQVQRGLTAVGHNPGGADGVLGPRSRDAIRSYQRAIGAEPTGYLTPDQARALQANAPPFAPAERQEDEDPAERTDQVACEDAGGTTTRTYAISIGNVSSIGPRTIARRDCQSQLDAAVSRCLSEGGRVLPRAPSCTCMNDWAATECFFQPATQPDFRCEITEVAAVPEACR
ncbi:MAG: protein kinase [Alphaproteobacteria bacterium]|jgi:outer membrane protein assembly factor BamD (BamD/ComL family)/tRNA A-37 threonylcarbamoyl transferase component Bud32/peptidoglycan hydrolase-like protein with peptidoglycan-binding domain|nr:protein kinase [Alphaproteobacteria bacterium]